MRELKWWQKAVFYQVYPRSFADGNGDGIGDLMGLNARLDYLKDLGIDAIWLSPHYPSPLFDCGYDVADYQDVAPEYGDLVQFKELLDQAHQKGIRIILDLVLNHTSDQHPWFLESRSSRDNPKRDWYIWRDGQDDGPPNNWLSTFGGPAWTYDEQTGQYYYHFFFRQQPDLNWRNPAVKQAMLAVVRFWLDLGVDGFRIDAIGAVYEAPDLRPHHSPAAFTDLLLLTHAANSDGTQRARLEEMWKELFQHQVDRPELHELLRELRSEVDAYEDRVLIGETAELSYHGQGDELHMVFNFPLMNLEKLSGKSIHLNQQDRLEGLAAISPHEWPANTLGNHDTDRIYSRLDDGQHGDEWARLGAALMVCLRGTPLFYNGEEIGMRNLYLQEISQFRDMLGVWYFQTVQEYMGLNEESALAAAAGYSRDRCRTPMQWDSSPNAGFSPAGVDPWLPVHPNFAYGINVAAQDQDPESLLSFYRAILRMRQQTPALVEGDYRPLHHDQEDYLAFTRSSHPAQQTILVVLNFSEHSLSLDFSEISGDEDSAKCAYILFSTHSRVDKMSALHQVQVEPSEVYLAEVR
jgi:alpha-glucosidase